MAIFSNLTTFLTVELNCHEKKGSPIFVNNSQFIPFDPRSSNTVEFFPISFLINRDIAFFYFFIFITVYGYLTNIFVIFKEHTVAEIPPELLDFFLYNYRFSDIKDLIFVSQACALLYTFATPKKFFGTEKK